jgi:hypothetical protein
LDNTAAITATTGGVAFHPPSPILFGLTLHGWRLWVLAPHEIFQHL